MNSSDEERRSRNMKQAVNMQEQRQGRRTYKEEQGTSKKDTKEQGRQG